MELGKRIIETALSNGASLAGIADIGALRASPSHRIYPRMAGYAGVGTVQDHDKLAADQLFRWPQAAKSVLVIALAHPRGREEMDWWDGKAGTPGNRRLIEIIRQTSEQIEDELGIPTIKLHYYVEKGGVFLKDAAVLAGLGCIGRNNLLVTREHGPRVRLRALFLEADIAPTGPVEFDPCAKCKVFCRRVCPEKSMAHKAASFASMADAVGLPARDGSYDRELCNLRMEKDIAASNRAVDENSPIKYCRKCEFVCPVGM